MDFAFTEEQRAFREELRSWLRQNLPESWKQTHGARVEETAGHEYRREWERKLFEAGYAAMHWPKEYGGRGLTVYHSLIVSEELGRAGAPEPFNTSGLETAGPLLMANGSDEQKRTLLPRIPAVQDIWCQGFTEPEAGSDLAAVRTSARRQGDGWLINGRKIWTSHAHEADWCILLARSDPEAKTAKAMTVFAVPMSTKGVTVRPLAQLNGKTDFNEILFEDVLIPGDSNIGPVNDGWRVATLSVARERALIRLYRQALFQNEFEHIYRVAMNTERRGRPLSEDSNFRQQAADIYALLRIFRAQNLRVISRVDAGETIGSEASFLRLLWTEMRQKIGHLGLEVLGSEAAFEGAETSGNGRFQNTYFVSRADTIFAGTSQIQRNIIAERVLGLPR